MIMLRSVSVLFCLMSAALTDAVGVLTASPSMTSVLAQPTVPAHSQLASGNRRSTVAQWAAANMRSAASRRASYASRSERVITPVCKCEAPIVQDSVPETTASISGPVPRPCHTDAAVIVFHQQSQLLGPDTCLMTLHINRDDFLVFDDIEWALKMALEKLQIAGYPRAVLIVDREHSDDAAINEILTEAGYQLHAERSPSENLPKEVMWMKTLPLAKGNESKAAFTPMMTVAGGVPYPHAPELFHLDTTDSLAIGRGRLENIRRSTLVDFIDIQLQKFQIDQLSHAVVMIDAASAGTGPYDTVIGALQELGFQPMVPHPKQKPGFANTEFWMKKL